MQLINHIRIVFEVFGGLELNTGSQIKDVLYYLGAVRGAVKGFFLPILFRVIFMSNITIKR